jgi:hypothetical protein
VDLTMKFNLMIMVTSVLKSYFGCTSLEYSIHHGSKLIVPH